LNTRTLLISSLGNVVEWLDFGLLIYLAPIIGQNFFPPSDPHSASLATFSVFALGFLARPVGGIVFGHLGDRYGRAQTLRLSIFLATLTTVLMGLLPTYQQIGIAASVLLSVVRLVQGLAVGGEYGGIMVYLAESAPAAKRGVFTCFAAIGANAGFLLATTVLTILSITVTTATLMAWAWRIPFLLVGLIGILLLYYRMQLVETPAYLHLQQFATIVKQPFLVAIRRSPFTLLRIISLTCMGTTFYYAFFGYMPHYLIQSGRLKFTSVFIVQTVFLSCMLIFILLAGILGDKWGRKRMLQITASGMLLAVVPCFYLLHQNYLPYMILAFTIATLLSALEQGNNLSAMVENCPTDIRYTAVSFAYNCGNALFGGTAPLIIGLLSQRFNYFAPIYYLLLMVSITLVGIFSLPATVCADEMYKTVE
jgi:MFS transporter, MHS family, proline/betaine transporter